MNGPPVAEADAAIGKPLTRLGPPSAHSRYRPGEFEAHLVRWRDVRGLIAVYRGRTPEARAYYHQIPFESRPMLFLLFAYALAGRWLFRPLFRLAPRLAFTVMVARPTAGGPVAGFGTIHGSRTLRGERATELGLMVHHEMRGRGVGEVLHLWMARYLVGSGVEHVTGSVHSDNARQIALLTRWGLVVVGSVDDPRSPGKRRLLLEADIVKTYMARIRELEGAGEAPSPAAPEPPAQS